MIYKLLIEMKLLLYMVINTIMMNLMINFNNKYKRNSYQLINKKEKEFYKINL